MDEHPDRERERLDELAEEHAREEERMDTVTRHTPAPHVIGPGRRLYELAGPADPTYDELSERLRRAYQSAARYLAWEEAQARLPGALQTPQQPETAVEAYERHIKAVMAALKRSPFIMGADGGDPTDAQWHELAGEVLAAADVGF